MGNHGPDPAVVFAGRLLETVERRLQNGGREDDYVHKRVVVGVNGGRTHFPAGLINGLAKAAEVFGSRHLV